MLDYFIYLLEFFKDIFKTPNIEINNKKIPRFTLLQSGGIFFDDISFDCKGIDYSFTEKRLFFGEIMDYLKDYTEVGLKRAERLCESNYIFEELNKSKKNSLFYGVDLRERKSIIQAHINKIHKIESSYTRYKKTETYNYKVKDLKDLLLIKDTIIIKYENVFYNIPSNGISAAYEIYKEKNYFFLSKSLNKYYNMMVTIPQYSNEYLAKDLNLYLNILDILKMSYSPNIKLDANIKDSLLSLIIFDSLEEINISVLRYYNDPKNNFGFIILYGISSFYDSSLKSYCFTQFYKMIIESQFIFIKNSCYKSFMQHNNCNLVYSTIFDPYEKNKEKVSFSSKVYSTIGISLILLVSVMIGFIAALDQQN